MRNATRAAAAAAAATALVGAFAGLAAGAPATSRVTTARTGTVVAPYVDIGSPELFPTVLAAIARAKVPVVTAAFVVSRHGCTPRWDSEKPVAHDPTSTRFLREVRASGAKLIVSFGGALSKPNHELAETCRSVPKLASAYGAVIRDTHVSRLDFDIEGGPLGRSSVNERRFAALRRLQQRRPNVSISLTVPVDTNGLPGSVLRLLSEARSAHLRLGLLNIMTMDYGGRHEMGSAAIRAAQKTLPQLRRSFPSASWRTIGITPMIGRNDSAVEIFRLRDARTVRRFGVRHHLGRLAFWSLGRDRSCDSPEKTAQYDCSGVGQGVGAFSRAFTGR